MSQIIEISVQRILEQIGYFLIQSLQWGHQSTCSESVIAEQRQNFKVLVDGVMQLLTGTHFCPGGTPRKEFLGVNLTQEIVDELLTGKYYPLWTDQTILQNALNQEGK